MTDYIKREDAIKELLGCVPTDFHEIKDLDVIRVMLALPSADVAPVRHGRWEVVDAEEPRRFGCSICGRLSWYMDNYCPNCGAKMDKEENDGDQ